MKLPKAFRQNVSQEITLEATRDKYGETLARLGEKYPQIVVLDADLSESTRTSKFAKKFPERFFNMGVAEQDMIGTAAGLATTGKIVFASSFAIFASGRCWEQIRQSVAHTNLNVKIVASHGGLSVGEDGATHQGNEDVALMRVLPNVQVIVPADGPETVQVIETIVEEEGPFYVRTGRSKEPVIMPKDYRFQLGRGIELNPGNDVTIIGMGIMVARALEAAAILENEGVSARVINMSSVKPIDEELIIKAAEETGAIVTAEEHQIVGGLGSAVAEVLSENRPVLLKRVGVPNCFGRSCSGSQILDHFNLNSKGVADAVRELLASK